MFKIPSPEKRYFQPNSSDLGGNVFSTKNVNFDEEGYLKLSNAPLKMTSTDSQFASIDAMFKSKNDIYFLSQDLFSIPVFSETNTFVNRTISESAPSPSVEEDGVYFNGTQVVSDGNTISRNNAGTWTTIAGTSLPSTIGLAVSMEVFPAGNSLVVARGTKVILINTSWAVSGTNVINLAIDYEVTSLAVVGGTIYIATRHSGNGDARVFLWDGIGTAVTTSYSVGTFEMSTIKAYNSSIVGVNSLGQFVRFTGGGFESLANFPIFYSGLDWGSSLNNFSFISNRGMYVDGDLVYFNVSCRPNNDLLSTYLYNMPGGLWCFDPQVGLYHRNSQTKTLATPQSILGISVNVSTDQITVSSAPATGSMVYFKDINLNIPSLKSDTLYYVIYVSATSIRLASTYANALSNTYIDFSSVAGGSSGSLVFITVNDWGDTFTGNRGSVLSLPSGLYSGMFDRTIYTNSIKGKTDSDNYGVNSSTSQIQARGYFITPKLQSSIIEDIYNTITLRFRPLKVGDEIRVKYRKQEKVGLPTGIIGANPATWRITWTSQTTFTTVLDWSGVSLGDEVEIVGGQGAGHIAHVTNIQRAGGVTTVTIDEACSVVSNGDFAKAIANNWTYLGKIDSNDKDYKSFVVDRPSGWVQFKIEMRGIEVTIQELIVDNKDYKRPR